MLLNSNFYATCQIMSSPEPFACIANKFVVSLSDVAAELFLSKEKKYTLCKVSKNISGIKKCDWPHHVEPSSDLVCMQTY